MCAMVTHSVPNHQKKTGWLILVLLLLGAGFIVLMTLKPLKPTTRLAVVSKEERATKLEIRKNPADHLYHIDDVHPTAIDVTYRTGRPYPGAGTFDAQTFVLAKINGDHGKTFVPDFPLQNLNCSEGKSTTVRIELSPIGAATPVAFGVHTFKWQDIIVEKVELILPLEEPDPFA